MDWLLSAEGFRSVERHGRLLMVTSTSLEHLKSVARQVRETVDTEVIRDEESLEQCKRLLGEAL